MPIQVGIMFYFFMPVYIYVCMLLSHEVTTPFSETDQLLNCGFEIVPLLSCVIFDH